MDLISPQELKQELPLSDHGIHFLHQNRRTIENIFERRDPRLLLIIGPCSIHNVNEALEFAHKLQNLATEMKDSCFIVMRAYVEKPRTAGGWQGLVHDPYLNGSNDISQGLFLARSLLLQLAEMEMPIATEFLTPHLSPYFEDLVTWGCIGARTTSSPVHRLLASHLPMPIGFKNTVEGNIQAAINGVAVARQPHHFLHIDETGKLCHIQSKGNPFAHVVLRGATTHTNYEKESIQKTVNILRKLELPPRILIDCSHGNCQGKYFKQKEAFYSALEQIKEGNQQILGMMLESNLEASSQKIPSQLSDLQRGVSITDPCLDFSTMSDLVRSVQDSSSMVMSLNQS